MSGFVEGSAAELRGPLIAPGLLAGQLQQQQRDGRWRPGATGRSGRRGGHDGGGRTSWFWFVGTAGTRAEARRVIAQFLKTHTVQASAQEWEGGRVWCGHPG